MVPSVLEVFNFMRSAHQGQKDAQGEPYWKHPYEVYRAATGRGPKETRWFGRVWSAGRREIVGNIALLHDVLEDTDITPVMLQDLGMSYAVGHLSLLTRTEDLTYASYIDRIVNSGSKEALVVKRADLWHNTLESRVLDRPELRTRYERAKLKIDNALKEQWGIERDS